MQLLLALFYPPQYFLRIYATVFDNEHSMDWTNAKILDFELDFTKRRFIESYFINQIPNTMNDKQNDKFPSIVILLFIISTYSATQPYLYLFGNSTSNHMT